jgi:hypothetical protein
MNQVCTEGWVLKLIIKFENVLIQINDDEGIKVT